MFINVRLRDGRDADIEAWYIAQEDRSEEVRKAIRAYMRLQNGESQEVVIRDAVIAAMGGELARLPDLVAGAVRDALANYQLRPAQEQSAPGDEDPKLAARLDAQLDDFFKE